MQGLATYGTDYDIYGRRIMVNYMGSEVLNLRYITDYTDVSGMSAKFINVLKLSLALEVAYAFSVKPNVVKMVAERLAAIEDKAEQINGQERPPRRVEYSPSVAARRGGNMYPFGNGGVAGKFTTFS